MRTHKASVTVPEDHRLEVCLPEEFPAGPAEVIVSAETTEERPEQDERGRAERRSMTAVIQELRSLRPTDEEERILDEFDRFRQEHPFRLSSLPES